MTPYSCLVVCLLMAGTAQVLGYDSAMYEDMLFQDLYKRLSQMDTGYYPLDDMGYNNMQWGDEDNYIPLDSRESGQADIRDPEYLAHSSISDGFQYISGGAGEGQQHLTPEGTQENTQEVKSDEILPFYCHPPNPCPKGFTEEDGCQLNVKDTAEVQKAWISQMQAKGLCTCDEEHMFDCGAGQPEPEADMMGQSQEGASGPEDLDDFINSILGDKEDEYKHMKNPYIDGEEIQGLVAKKSPRIKRSTQAVERQLKGLKFKRSGNPYLQGKLLHTVAKKGGQM